VTGAPADALEVVRPGLATTVQDLGRPGGGRFGVSASGAMDRFAHRLANRLAGNAEGAAALELTGAGCTLRFLRPLRFALAGADLDATLDGETVAWAHVGMAPAGATLQLGSRRRGARAALAIGGGLDVPPVLGSAATDLGAALGGIDGRPLRTGQRLRQLAPQGGAGGPAGGALATEGQLSRLRADLHPLYGDPFLLRFVPEEDAAVPLAARGRMDGGTFLVSSRSGRTGYRFEGEPLPCQPDPERLSEPTAPGALQLPPDGLPILLMADGNTVGGYPRLGHLASADRSRAAQLWPGDRITFLAIALEEATRLARDAEARFQAALTALSG
jgi:biotin-dependent carboxylase-like uncharacterized protein